MHSLNVATLDGVKSLEQSLECFQTEWEMCVVAKILFMNFTSNLNKHAKQGINNDVWQKGY